MTTVLHNPHQCCPPAYDCACCTHKIRGIYFTLSGASNGDPGCEEDACSGIDGNYYVPNGTVPFSECSGNVTFELPFKCNENDQFVRIRWDIFCEEIPDVLEPGQLMLEVFVKLPETDAEMRYRNIINAPGSAFPTDCTPVDGAMGDRTHLGWPIFVGCSLDDLNVTAVIEMEP